MTGVCVAVYIGAVEEDLQNQKCCESLATYDGIAGNEKNIHIKFQCETKFQWKKKGARFSPCPYDYCFMVFFALGLWQGDLQKPLEQISRRLTETTAETPCFLFMCGAVEHARSQSVLLLLR